MHLGYTSKSKIYVILGIVVAIAISSLTVLSYFAGIELFLLVVLFNSIALYICFQACLYNWHAATAINVEVRADGCVLFVASYISGVYEQLFTKNQISQIIIKGYGFENMRSDILGLKLYNGKTIWVEQVNDMDSAVEIGAKLADYLNVACPRGDDELLSCWEAMDDYRSWMSPRKKMLIK